MLTINQRHALKEYTKRRRVFDCNGDVTWFGIAVFWTVFAAVATLSWLYFYARGI